MTNYNILTLTFAAANVVLSRVFCDSSAAFNNRSKYNVEIRYRIFSSPNHKTKTEMWPEIRQGQCNNQECSK